MKVGFFNLSNNDKNSLKSIINILDRRKEVVIVEDFDNDEATIIITDEHEPKLEDVLKNNPYSSFVLITSSIQDLNPSLNPSLNYLEKPFSVQKIFSLMNKIKSEIKPICVVNEPLKFSKENIFKIEENFLISDGKSFCLVLKDEKEIHHNFEGETLEEWLQRKDLKIEGIICDKEIIIKKYNLNKNFVYSSLYYLLHYSGENANIKEDTRLKLEKFPNIFPQNTLQDVYKDFYHICFYLLKKERSATEVSVNLNIPIESILKCANALYKLDFLTKIEKLEKIEVKSSQVKSIFSRIKKALGIV